MTCDRLTPFKLLSLLMDRSLMLYTRIDVDSYIGPEELSLASMLAPWAISMPTIHCQAALQTPLLALTLT